MAFVSNNSQRGGYMKQEQTDILYKYKQIIYKIFKEEIQEITGSNSIGSMGQFQITFYYKPTKLSITLDADRGAFALHMKDEANDSNTLYRIKKFDNEMTEECLEKALIILKQILEKNDFPLYKSENNKLYKKKNGVYHRVKDIAEEFRKTSAK